MTESPKGRNMEEPWRPTASSAATALDTAASVYYVCYDPKAMSGGADLLHALRIRYTDPGPRNF